MTRNCTGYCTGGLRQQFGRPHLHSRSRVVRAALRSVRAAGSFGRITIWPRWSAEDLVQHQHRSARRRCRPRSSRGRRRRGHHARPSRFVTASFAAASAPGNPGRRGSRPARIRKNWFCTWPMPATPSRASDRQADRDQRCFTHQFTSRESACRTALEQLVRLSACGPAVRRSSSSLPG